MAVGLAGLPALHTVSGVRLGVGRAGFKYPDRRDLVVMALDAGVAAAGVFTRNAFCAAPVTVARRHLAAAAPRYLLVNTGNANAGTGAAGMQTAEASCELLARLGGCRPEEVLPFSTGVIGEPLALQPFSDTLPAVLSNLREDLWADAAHGIMTTDTVPKGASVRTEIGGETVTVTGIAKGAGMIRPDMATMLAFVATDCRVPGPLLQTCLQRAVHASFNCITVDGDTSTNDACVLAATGRAGPAAMSAGDAAFTALCEAVTQVCETLARAIVRDGEGATKFITIEVAGGANEQECRAAAYTVAHSPLVKTAFFGSDPNWGRILAALGRSGVPDLDVGRVAVDINGVAIVRGGARAGDYEERRGLEAMRAEEIHVLVDLGRGRHGARVWTCDLSYDYVRINTAYRT